MLKRLMLSCLAMVSTGTAFAALPEVQSDLAALGRGSSWTPAGQITLGFETHHPQGMLKIGDHYFMSSVEIQERPEKYQQPQGGMDRSPGKGRAHLFQFDQNGKLLRDIVLAEGEGDIYHPGGIDTDGKYIYVPVAEYRPNSRSVLYRIEIKTGKVEEVLRYNDHLGGVVIDPAGGKLHMVSWGSRRWYSWDLNGAGLPITATARMQANPLSYIDYQDCHHMEGELALCSGVAYMGGHPSGESIGLGGLEVVNFNEGRVVAGFPVPLWDPVKTDGVTRAMATNPFTVWKADKGLRFAFAPHDGQTVVYLYDVK